MSGPNKSHAPTKQHQAMFVFSFCISVFLLERHKFDFDCRSMSSAGSAQGGSSSASGAPLLVFVAAALRATRGAAHQRQDASSTVQHRAIWVIEKLCRFPNYQLHE